MPRGDGTGPRGLGTKKGRRMGNCLTSQTPKKMGLGCGQGKGMGKLMLSKKLST